MISKQIMYGEEHYCFPYPDMTELLNDVQGWCKQNCKGPWDKDIAGFTFKDEQDLFLFLLRWA